MALAFSLGLGSMAVANHLVVNRSDIVDNAVNGRVVDNESLTGKDVKEKTFKKVPKAAKVDGASGDHFARFEDYSLDPNKETTVMSLAGLRISYKCYRPGDDVAVAINARSSVSDARLLWSVIRGAEGYGNSNTRHEIDFDPGDVVDLKIDSSFGIVNLTYTTPKQVVAGTLSFLAGSVDCLASGSLMGGPR